MNWFFIALINPIAHAAVNHIDKYLISRYVKGGSVGTLILFSALFSVVALPVIYFIHPNVFSVIQPLQALVLMINGGLLVTAIILYLYALGLDEASYVAPFFQLVPVIGFILGFLLLGEGLHGNQIMAGMLIVCGGIILSLEFGEGKKKIKTKLILLMLGSSFFYALNAVVFKSIAVHQGFLDSLFWDMAGKFVFGLVLFFAVKSYRQQFIDLIKTNRYSIIGLNILNEVIALVGEIALVLAVLFAPVALVQSVAGLQPAFVFIIGVLVTLLFPKIAQESLQRKMLLQKIGGILVITIGVYLLEFSQK